MKDPNTRKRAKKRLIARKTKRFAKRSVHALCRLLLFGAMLLLIVFCVVWILFLRVFNAQQLSERITTQLQKQLNRPKTKGRDYGE